MTVSTSTPARPAATAPAIGRLPGFGALVRRELTEWRRGLRGWITVLASTFFMVPTALNQWIIASLGQLAPEQPPPMLDPFLNLAAGVSAQLFVVIAIFVVMSLLVAERESGTLAWTASKPVSRSAIWLAKATAASAMLWLLGVIVPMAVTVVLVLALYGPLPVLPVVLLAIGAGMATALFVVIGLAASTVATSQAAVAAVGFAALFLPGVVAALVPIEPYLPTAILGWALALATGQPAGIATPISWAFTIIVLVTFSLRRMERLEL